MQRVATVVLTTDSSGAGTAITDHPLFGELERITAGTILGAGTLTLDSDSYQLYSGTVSGTAFEMLQLPIVDGYVTVTVSGGEHSKSDTVKIYYEE